MEYLQQREKRFLMKMYHLNIDIQEITLHGGTWKRNLTTGESVFIGRKLNKEEKQKVENLKAELKQLEVELKIAEMEEDFKNNNKEEE